MFIWYIRLLTLNLDQTSAPYLAELGLMESTTMRLSISKILGAVLSVSALADALVGPNLANRDTFFDSAARSGLLDRRGAEASVFNIYTWSDGGAVYANRKFTTL